MNNHHSFIINDDSEFNGKQNDVQVLEYDFRVSEVQAK